MGGLAPLAAALRALASASAVRRLAPLALAAALALATSACVADEQAPPPGSTLETTLVDRDGDALLEPGPPEPLLERTELAPTRATGRELARFAQITDAHVLDEESPARVPFLDRLGPPFQSAFRPQEALSEAVLDAAVRSLNALRPRAVVLTGDLVDNAQRNELDQALAVLRGGWVDPDSGARGYDGVQSAANADPSYYRPEVDPPRHAGLLDRAQRRFRAQGLRAPWYPVVGNHDVMSQGALAATDRVREVAVGDRVLTRPPSGEGLPDRGDELTPELVDGLLAGGLPGETTATAPDPARVPLAASETIERQRAASGNGALRAGLLDYSFDIGHRLRAVVLDTARREQGSSGVVRPSQARWLAAELRRAKAGERRVIVFSHHPLARAAGARRALAALDRSPAVIAAVSGHVHRNSIEPRHSRGGGYWEIATASLADHPQQSRAFRLVEAAAGAVALETWMVDHAGGPLAGPARELAFVDAQGGRPNGAAGRPADRNARLHVP